MEGGDNWVWLCFRIGFVSPPGDYRPLTLRFGVVLVWCGAGAMFLSKADFGDDDTTTKAGAGGNNNGFATPSKV